MGVRALPRLRASQARRSRALPPLALVVVLAPTALDLFRLVQPGYVLAAPCEAASALALTGLVAMWVRAPRTMWLVAASLAAAAGLVMRMVGLDLAPLLSLLSIVALGVGGAFASDKVRSASA